MVLKTNPFPIRVSSDFYTWTSEFNKQIPRGQPKLTDLLPKNKDVINRLLIDKNFKKRIDKLMRIDGILKEILR